jgi:hypothetical protein
VLARLTDQPQHRDETKNMIRTYLRAGLCLLAAASAQAADWTSFKLGTLNSFSINYSHLPDGRIVYGTGGTVAVQKTFGTKNLTVIPAGTLTLDPSFTAVRSATSAIVGAGGASGASGLHVFNPSSPSTAVSSSALATMQNFNGVFWKHPTSGREGWLIGGGNGTNGSHNVTFVSLDGTHVGAITGDISSYSAGIAVDAFGNLYTALFELNNTPNAAESEKVYKFSAAQVDAAVAAVIVGAPAPATLASAAFVFQFQSAASLVVDELGRIWATGFSVNLLECYDPSLNASRTFTPDHSALANASGAPNYLLSTFRRNGVEHLSFLALDSFYTTGSDVVHGYRPTEQLVITLPQIACDTAVQTVSEAAGTANLTVSLTVPATTRVTVPFTLSGQATRRLDYSSTASAVVFERGETSKSITLSIVDDALDEEDEILVVTLGNPTPIWSAELGAQLTHTITIEDNDTPPVFSAGDTLLTARVGSSYSQPVALEPDANPSQTRFTATGLPPGLRIDLLTGMISGRPTVPGEFFEIVISARNAAGMTKSQAFLLQVEDFPTGAKGNFTALSDRLASSDGVLGARLDLATTAAGNFTGRLSFGGRSFPISGPLDTSMADPTGSATITRPGKTPLVINFMLSGTTGDVSGSLADGAAPANLTGWKARSSTTVTGTHHFAASLVSPTPAQPAGATHGAVTVTSSATTQVVARLADGSSIATGGLLGSNGQVPVYQVLYSAPGSVLGVLEIANDAGQTVSGSFSWSKPQQPNNSTAHPAGWSAPITVLATGGKYRAVSGSTIILALPASVGNNAQLLFSGANVDTSATEPDLSLRLLPPASVAAPNVHRLRVDVKKGTFTGSFTLQDGAVKRVAAFEGRLIPDTSTPAVFDGTGQGFFLLTPLAGGPKASGAVQLTP